MKKVDLNTLKTSLYEVEIEIVDSLYMPVSRQLFHGTLGQFYDLVDGREDVIIKRVTCMRCE